jgi:nucleoside-diphosphate-sugar epimerase
MRADLRDKERNVAVFITGGVGFIGSALIRHYVDQGLEVLAFDYQNPSDAQRELWGNRVTFEQGDIRDTSLIASLVERSGATDPVIHLAAMLTAGCDRDPDAAIAINLGGARNVFGACSKAGRRVILASTIGVYGRGLPQPIEETMATEPDGWYGYTKIAAEQMGLLYNRREGLDFRAVRLAAVTGPFRRAVGSASMFTSMIPEKAALGEPYEVEVSQDTAYPVVYIKDVVNAIARLGEAGEAPARIYNVGSGRVVVSEMIAAVRKRIPNSQFTFKPDPVVMQVVSGYREWRISCRRIAEELGWEPAYDVDRMVDDIIDTVRGAKAS